MITEGLQTRFAEPKELSVATHAEVLQRVERIVIAPEAIEIYLVPREGEEEKGVRLRVPWAPQKFILVKGISRGVHDEANTLKSESGDALLGAIAKARTWVDGLVEGRIQSVAQIAQKEGKGERHIRLLLPLAFTPPTVVQSIVMGTAKSSIAVTGLAKAVPLLWAGPESGILEARYGDELTDLAAKAEAAAAPPWPLA